MKYHLIITVLFFSFSLFSQEKGVSPLEGGASVHPEASSVQTYAVVVGISDYQDEAIPDLRFADKDAEAFANFLRSPAGGSLDEDHLKVLVNEQATLGQFAAALDWLWEVANENDRVIIYFSGHGDVERKSILNPGYLLCWDAPESVYMGGGALNVRDLKGVVSTLSLQNKAKVVLITDACRAGKLSGSEIKGAQATASTLNEQFANELKILSCQPDEYSIEGEQWGGGRGAFSYHLIDGLYGMADRNTDLSVNLMEIRSYLEENVSAEVAPHNQYPMVVGNGREKLTDVFPNILEQLKEGKKGQMQLFSPTDSRGMEEEVLAAADTNVVELFLAFQKAVEAKFFLEPENACADYYYNKLSKEPQLEPLHSSMRRNYAAALQNDAQQVLNKWLKGDASELIRSRHAISKGYRLYPSYMERAAELLGPDHYFYPVLKGRSLFFKTYRSHYSALGREKDRLLEEQLLANYRQVIKWQPEAPYVYYAMALVYSDQMTQPDSAEYFAHKATELAPGWIIPYTHLASRYQRYRDLEKGQYFLDLAKQVDSVKAMGSQFYLTILANHYNKTKQFDKAVNIYRKAIQIDSSQAFLYYNLGNMYNDDLQNPDKAIQLYKKAISLDSTYAEFYDNLGSTYIIMNRNLEAEVVLKKAIQLDSLLHDSYNRLGIVMVNLRRFEEAEKYYKKTLEIAKFDPERWLVHSNLGILYHTLQRWQEAANMTQKALSLMPNDGGLLSELAYAYSYLQEQKGVADSLFEESIALDADWPDTYIYRAQYTLRQASPNSSVEEAANHFLEQGFAKGVGKNGALSLPDLQTRKDFAILRKTAIWQQLIKKYFPEQNKTKTQTE